MKITYCMIARNRLYDVMRCIERVKPYVDRVIIIDGGSTDDSIFTLRNYDGVELYVHPWKDNFAEQRTRYLRRAEEKGGTDWILVSDSDELFSVPALENMRGAIDRAGRYNMLAFQSVSVTTKGEKVINKHDDDFWKPLLFKWIEGIRYDGLIHEGLARKDGYLIKNLPYQYYHIKQQDVVWQRGARNAFISGMSTEGKRTELWEPFRALVRETTGMELWTDFDEYLIGGNIDQRIKDSFIKFKDVTGFQSSSEWREMYKLYFRVYHPEEEPEQFKNSRIE